jgi:hypothetical protein
MSVALGLFIIGALIFGVAAIAYSIFVRADIDEYDHEYDHYGD